MFLLLIFGSVAFTYYKIMVKKNYLISMEINCDPYEEKCFVYKCNPAQEECAGDSEEDSWYYKIINKKAFNIPNCNPDKDENCVITCDDGEKDCSYNLCEDGNSEKIECNDSVEYTKNNPPEEEEIACEEGDEECATINEAREDSVE